MKRSTVRKRGQPTRVERREKSFWLHVKPHDEPGTKEWRVPAGWKKLGFTLEDYERLFEEQRGRCGICRREVHYRLCVDHDHDTMEVRGLLCRPCNTKLDWAIRQKKRIKRYLRR